MPTDDIDKLILSFSSQQWQKVARILAKTLRECEQRHISTSYEDIAERIAALIGIRLLEAQGDITNWRHSEVRLPSDK
jgi:hypothetical protein